MRLSPEIIETMFRYSGITALFVIFLYLLFWQTINKKFFSSLSQKRKVGILIFTPFLIWSMGILVILLIFIKENKQVVIEEGFIYGGQIVNENGYPISKAYVYIILRNDTIKSETPTGDDGLFTIKLDTVEGIKTTIYYGHPKYGSNTVFRALSSSITERLVLKRLNGNFLPKKTFSININDDEIIKTVEKITGMKYQAINANHTIKFQYDKTGLDNFDNRYRYLGGKVQILIDQSLCCQSSHFIKATNAAGFNYKIISTGMKIINMIICIERISLEKRIFFLEKIHLLSSFQKDPCD